MNILIIGATSTIAQATAREMIDSFSKESLNITLIARDSKKLKSVEHDLISRKINSVNSFEKDLGDIQQVESFIKEVWNESDGFDIALLAHGTLPNQIDVQASASKSLNAFTINCLSHLAIMTELANLMEARGSGVIAVIGSVAGDRGRQSNYLYGTAKGSIELFAQGLRNRLFSKGVHVLTIKPGFVDTPMTKDFDKSGPLWASPQKVAQDIVKAIQKKKNSIYTPSFWFFIMAIIKFIPEPIFKRLKL